ncbi:MAG TPA: fumarylacetoacetate hydrolase family protein, partial [Candidatus Binatia bacterium]|nr:fumarylacetoacetate hydrolase family protein [Candidatus Binatia bacterium]
MKIVLFGPERRIGAWRDDRIIDLNRAFASYLRDQRGEANAQTRADEKIPMRLERFIALGRAALEDAERALEHATKQGAADVFHDVKSVKLHAPWPERRIACVGGNYAAHLAGMWAGRPGVTGDLAQITRLAKEEGQWGFWKTPAEVAGPDDVIPYPKRTRRFDYEGEVAIVIGKRGKDISAEQIDEYVWG